MKPRIAFVYDRVNKWGGAERVLLALHELWPDAPLYTAVYDKDGAPWADVFDVRQSFLQHIPFAKRHHELFSWLAPMAFETFDFDGFDVVISITSAEAKSIITKPGTIHICYCLTPTRYLWSGVKEYEAHPGFGLFDGIIRNLHRRLLPTLQRWDRISAKRPDKYVAISEQVAGRVKQYYGRRVDQVIYPPVDVEEFRIPFEAQGRQSSTLKGDDGKYYLLVSRLVGYKRVDVVIDAFNDLGWPLVIIGDGRERNTLERQAQSNITIISRHLTDEELVGYYQRCRAFVFAGSEDFGIAAVEAQACGKSVIAYRNSGLSEIVREGTTGTLFDRQEKKDLARALERFDKTRYDSHLCRKNAERFTKALFEKNMKSFVETAYNQRGSSHL